MNFKFLAPASECNFGGLDSEKEESQICLSGGKIRFSWRSCLCLGDLAGLELRTEFYCWEEFKT